MASGVISVYVSSGCGQWMGDSLDYLWKEVAVYSSCPWSVDGGFA